MAALKKCLRGRMEESISMTDVKGSGWTPALWPREQRCGKCPWVFGTQAL